MGAAPTYCGYQGGDLIGVVERLDYLVDLGVNALYFTPIFQSASNHRYHTHDYEKVDPMLGGNPALRRLIDEAHSRGIRVVLDGVFNHASRGFFQFHDIMENGPNSAYLDWFTVKDFPLYAYDADKAPNYSGMVGIAGVAEVQYRLPRSEGVPLGDRPDVDGVRHRRLAARRPQRDRGRRLLARVPQARPRRQPRRVYRRRGLGRRPAMAPGRHVGCRDELPVHPRLHRLLHRRRGQPRGPQQDQPQPAGSAGRRGRSARRSSGSSASITRT